MTKKIFRSVLAVACAVLLVFAAVLFFVLYGCIKSVYREELKNSLSLAAAALEGKGGAYSDLLSDSEIRLTLVSAAGEVLFNSKSPAADMENHSGREEIKEALQSGWGESFRFSSTLGEETLYCARLLPDGTVLRAAVSCAVLPEALLSVAGALLPVFILALLACSLIARRLSAEIVEPLCSLDLENPLENNAYDELSGLLTHIDRQRKQIESQLSELEGRKKEFFAVIKNMREGLLLLSSGGAVLSINPAAAELIENGLVPPEKLREFSGSIRFQAQRLVALIDNIIGLSRLDEGEAPPFEKLNLAEIAAAETATLKAEAQKKGVSLYFEGEDIIISSVPQLLHEIIYNLCDNAIKYNRENGFVRVIVKKTSKGACLRVADSGAGIPAEHQGRVFERFYRVDKSHSKETGGTGLGLSIVKHAVQYLGGSISLESTPGEGTEITVIFTQAGEPEDCI